MTFPNIAPIANAGPDLQLLRTSPNQSFMLDGSRSRDPDGAIAAYRWRQLSGPTATIMSPNVARTLATVPSAGTYQFELLITDNHGATSRDTMTATVTARANQAPVANAGTDIDVQLTGATATVMLDGSGSFDPDGTIAAFSWARLSGPAQPVIATPNSAVTTALLSVAGVYQFELTVTDAHGAIARDGVIVTVTTPAAPCGPTAQAGRDLVLMLPANGTVLDGSASRASEGTIIAYAWEQIGGPAAGCATGHDSARLTLTGLVAGSYRFRLTVRDSRGRSDSDEVNVAVGRPGVER